MIRANITTTYHPITSPSPAGPNEKAASKKGDSEGLLGAKLAEQTQRLDEIRLDHKSELTPQTMARRSMATPIPPDLAKFESAFEVSPNLPETRPAVGEDAAAMIEYDQNTDLIDGLQDDGAAHRKLVDAVEFRLPDRDTLEPALPRESSQSAESEAESDSQRIDIETHARSSRTVLEEFLSRLHRQALERRESVETAVDHRDERIEQAEEVNRLRSDEEYVLRRESSETRFDDQERRQQVVIEGVEAAEVREFKRDRADAARSDEARKTEDLYLSRLENRSADNRDLRLQSAEANPETTNAASTIPTRLSSDFVIEIEAALRQSPPVEPSAARGSMTPLVVLQREGVFGIAGSGRNLTLAEFAEQKEFEYNLDQQPFSKDEFLRETESAIYETLNRGNSSSVTRDLVVLAELVNSFRNHLVRAAETVEQVSGNSEERSEQPQTAPMPEDYHSTGSPGSQAPATSEPPR